MPRAENQTSASLAIARPPKRGIFPANPNRPRLKPAVPNREDSPGEPSAVRVLEELVQKAETAAASDVHLQMTGRAAQVSFRLDGFMTPVCELKEDVAERVFGRIKYLARLKTYQESLPQDGRIDQADLAARSDIRVATYPTVTGEKIVLRLFNTAVRSLDELALPANARLPLEQFLRRTSGLLLLTGPAGSGKTTTIYACLRALAAQGGRHIITVEDPAEQIVPGVMQTEICEARGLTFATAARHLLRQDPQVLVIGEMRDEETAAIAVRAALTGHLVISTLHAGSCQGVFERLLSLCPDRYSVFSAVELVLNQRLLRRLCPDCKGGAGRAATGGVSQRETPHLPSAEKAGCESCLHTGYRGRLPVAEWVRVDDALRARLRTEGPDAIQPALTLAAAARELVDRGLSDEREYQRVIGA